MNDYKNIGYKIGQLLALTVVTCIALCLCGLAVAGTIAFLSWIF